MSEHERRYDSFSGLITMYVISILPGGRSGQVRRAFSLLAGFSTKSIHDIPTRLLVYYLHLHCGGAAPHPHLGSPITHLGPFSMRMHAEMQAQIVLGGRRGCGPWTWLVGGAWKAGEMYLGIAGTRHPFRRCSLLGGGIASLFPFIQGRTGGRNALWHLLSVRPRMPSWLFSIVSQKPDPG